jgi:hypothetical protein
VPALLFLMVVIGGYGAFFADTGGRLEAFVIALVKGGAVLLAARWLVLTIDEAIKLRAHARRLERVRAFVERLPRGELSGPGFYSGGRACVTGQVDGRAYELQLRFSGRAKVLHELVVKTGGVECAAFAARGLAWLAGSPPRIVHGTAAPSRELRAALEDLVRDGFESVVCSGGTIRAEAPLRDRELRLERLTAACHALVRVAKFSEPSRAPAGEQRCPYCKGGVLSGERLEACLECQTVHHRECLDEARGCAVHGCAGGRVRRRAAVTPCSG